MKLEKANKNVFTEPVGGRLNQPYLHQPDGQKRLSSAEQAIGQGLGIGQALVTGVKDHLDREAVTEANAALLQAQEEMATFQQGLLSDKDYATHKEKFDAFRLNLQNKYNTFTNKTAGRYFTEKFGQLSTSKMIEIGNSSAQMATKTSLEVLTAGVDYAVNQRNQGQANALIDEAVAAGIIHAEIAGQYKIDIEKNIQYRSLKEAVMTTADQHGVEAAMEGIDEYIRINQLSLSDSEITKMKNEVTQEWREKQTIKDYEERKLSDKDDSFLMKKWMNDPSAVTMHMVNSSNLMPDAKRLWVNMLTARDSGGIDERVKNEHDAIVTDLMQRLFRGEIETDQALDEYAKACTERTSTLQQQYGEEGLQINPTTAGLKTLHGVQGSDNITQRRTFQGRIKNLESENEAWTLGRSKIAIEMYEQWVNDNIFESTPMQENGIPIVQDGKMLYERQLKDEVNLPSPEEMKAAQENIVNSVIDAGIKEQIDLALKEVETMSFHSGLFGQDSGVSTMERAYQDILEGKYIGLEDEIGNLPEMLRERGIQYLKENGFEIKSTTELAGGLTLFMAKPAGEEEYDFYVVEAINKSGLSTGLFNGTTDEEIVKYEDILNRTDKNRYAVRSLERSSHGTIQNEFVFLQQSSGSNGKWYSLEDLEKDGMVAMLQRSISPMQYEELKRKYGWME